MKTLSTIVLAVTAFVVSAQTTAESLEFLVGEWYTPEHGLYEEWVTYGDRMEGEAYSMDTDGKKVFEKMEILTEDSDLIFRVQREGSIVDFKLKSTEEGRYVFENLENEYPQRVIYWWDQNVPGARIEGDMDGQEQHMDFAYIAKKDKGAPAGAAAEESKSKLGDQVLVAIGVSDLFANKQFYEQLGFKEVFTNNDPFPMSVLTDGSMYLSINVDGREYFGLTYFSGNLDAKIAMLKKEEIAIEETTGGQIPMAIVVDPDKRFGIAVARGMLPGMKPIAVKSEGAAGKLGEIAIPVNDLETAAAWYEKLGFENKGKYTKPYPWGIWSDGLTMIGLHQSSHFSKPAITYFSPNSEDHIARVQALGLEVKNAMPGGDEKIKNGVVKSPAGWPVFMFNGDF